MLCHAQNTVGSIVHKIVTADLNWWLAVSDTVAKSVLNLQV